MAIGGIGGALLAGLEGYSQARQREQQNQEAQVLNQLRMQEFRTRQAEVERQRLGAQYLSGAMGNLGDLSNLGGGAPNFAGQAPPQVPTQGPDTVLPNVPTGNLPQLRPQPATFGGRDAGGGMSTGGALGLDRFEQLAAQRESSNRPYVGTGGTDLTPYIRGGNVDQYGFPNWPGIQTPQGRSTAGGLFQITKTNWDREAPKVGVSDFSPESQVKVERSLRSGPGGIGNWTKFNTPLARDVAREGITDATSHPPAQQGGQIANQLAQNFDPVLQNRAALQQIIQAVDKAAGPNADPEAKIWAVDHLYKYLAPADKMQWQLMSNMIRDQYRSETKTPQDYVDPQGNHQWITPGQPIPQGYVPAATGRQQAALAARTPSGDSIMTDDEALLVAQQYLAGDRTAIQGWGRGAQGDSNRVKIRKFITDLAKEKGMTGSEIAQSIAEFEGQKAGQRRLGTIEATLGTGLEESNIFAPMLREASHKVDRTQFPNVNAILMAAERGAGGEAVVRYKVAFNAMMGAYSQVLTRNGVPTDKAREIAERTFDPSLSIEQMDAVIDQVMMEIKGASRAPAAVREKMRERATGKGEETAAPSRGATAPAGAVPTVNSQQEYDKLPNGARYRGPDGTEYTKGQ